MSAPPKVLIAMGGVGLGNATRCFAISQKLEGAEVHVLTFGNGARFFGERGGRVHRLLPMILPTSLLSTVASLPINGVVFCINVLISFFWLLRLWPRLVLVDSEYSAILPSLLFGRRLVGLNNASVVCALWERYGSPDLRMTYWTREVWDALLCRVFHRTLVPTFEQGLSLPPRHETIPPIVRELPTESAALEGPPLVLRGGSQHLTPLKNAGELTLEEVGASHYVGDSLERIARAPVVICQGGFSSLSEVLAMGKVAIAAPLPGHAEQCINVRSLAARGAILEMETEEDLGDALERVASFERTEIPIGFNGADVAASFLLTLLDLPRRSAHQER